MMAFRKLLNRTRGYHADDYSIPIGSRYHPERAPLWEPDSPVEGTEEWIARGRGLELLTRKRGIPIACQMGTVFEHEHSAET